MGLHVFHGLPLMSSQASESDLCETSDKQRHPGLSPEVSAVSELSLGFPGLAVRRARRIVGRGGRVSRRDIVGRGGRIRCRGAIGFDGGGRVQRDALLAGQRGVHAHIAILALGALLARPHHVPMLFADHLGHAVIAQEHGAHVVGTDRLAGLAGFAAIERGFMSRAHGHRGANIAGHLGLCTVGTGDVCQHVGGTDFAARRHFFSDPGALGVVGLADFAGRHMVLAFLALDLRSINWAHHGAVHAFHAHLGLSSSSSLHASLLIAREGDGHEDREQHEERERQQACHRRAPNSE